MQVGIRELRASLRTWLDRVARGEEVVITERGVPVAKLVGIPGESVLERLVAEGLISPAKKPAPRLGRRRLLRTPGPVSEYVKAQRR